MNTIKRGMKPRLFQALFIIALLTCCLAGTLHAQLPTITSVSPSKAIPGTSVTITGTNFNTTPANNIVIFGAATASVTSASATTLTVTVPMGAIYRELSVTNTTSGLTAYSQYPFLPTYDNSNYYPDIVNFEGAVNFSTGSFPNSVKLADFDNDGMLDIVGGNFNAASVYLYRNTSTAGNVSMSSAGSLSAGASDFRLETGDLDGDGKIDIAIPNRNGASVTLYRNTSTSGSISFASAVTLSLPSAGPNCVSIADLDDDGMAEIVVGNVYNSTVSIFRNTGSPGTLSFAANMDISTSGSAYHVTTGDADGDGKKDIAVVYNSGGDYVTIYRNLSSPGTLSFDTAISIATASHPFMVALNDIDGDGKADLVFTNVLASRFSVLRNTGSPGTISFAATVDVTTSSFPNGFATGDFNGDGKPDVVIAQAGTGKLAAFRNTSSSGSISFGSRVEFSAYSQPAAVAAGDIDGDGKPDAVLTNQSSGLVSVFRNNPLAGITGSEIICPEGSTTLATITPGGTWTSASTSIATVDASSGTVTGVGAGTTLVSYVVPGGYTTTIVSVNPAPFYLSGPFSVKVGNTISLHSTESGVTWTSADPAIASSLSAGKVKGLSYGTAIISCVNSSGCYRTRTISVVDTVAPIRGVFSSCVGDRNVLSCSYAPGLSWTSSDESVATIGLTSGLVTGIAAGTAVITFTSLSGAYTTKEITVNALPSAITGALSLCAGGTSQLSCSPAGGTWSNSGPWGSIDETTGFVYGVVKGSNAVTYTTAAGCISTATVTVYRTPQTISGASTLCAGSVIALSNTASDGTWSSSDASVATINASGSVSGISAGTTTISYVLSPGCMVTKDLVVYLGVSTISGNGTLCVGTTVNLSNVIPGGTWSSSNPTVASVNLGTGVVTGNYTGLATITYTTASSCFATTEVTVNAALPAITGPDNVCISNTATLSNIIGGGTWTSSNTAIATADASSGVVSGVTSGVTTISYTLSTGCMATKSIVVVDGSTMPISGTTAVCAGNTTVLSCASGSGWSSSNTAVATVGSSSGVVTGITSGTAVITFTASSGCPSKTIVTVQALPSDISGTLTVCQGSTSLLSCTPSGGTWSSSLSYRASVGASTGLVTGITSGHTWITYTAPGNCYKTASVTVNALPSLPAITGPGNVPIGGSVTVVPTINGGTWTSENPAIATVTPSAGSSVTLAGISTGSNWVTYTLTNDCGTRFRRRRFTVVTAREGVAGETGLAAVLRIYPNPTQGWLKVSPPGSGRYEIWSYDARIVQSGPLKAEETQISLDQSLASGSYLFRFTGDDGCVINVTLTCIR